MKATELRIGNFIQYLMGDIITLELDGIDHIFKNIDKYKPIPLTEEWLEKLGIRKAFNDYDQIDFCGYYCDKLPQGGFIFKATETPIKYVHQLQNLYFALTEEELEIKELIKQK